MELLLKENLNHVFDTIVFDARIIIITTIKEIVMCTLTFNTAPGVVKFL